MKRNKIITLSVLFLVSLSTFAQDTIRQKQSEPLIMGCASGGFGFGFSSREKGQKRTLYSGDLTFVYKKYYVSYAGTNSDEFAPRTNFFLPALNIESPIETSKERSLVLGRVFYDSKFLYLVGAGGSLQNNITRGKVISGLDHEGIHTKNSFGISLEAQLLRHSQYFAFGLKGIATFNTVHTMGGLLFTIQTGFFGSKITR
jgi:hypothetical protein